MPRKATSYNSGIKCSGHFLKKIVALLLLLLSLMEAKDIEPLYRLHTAGFVTDFVLDGDKIYVATDADSVDIFALGSEQMIAQIVLEPVLSGRGERIPARINRIDRLNGKTLIISMGADNYRNVWVEENGRPEQIIDETKKLLIREARFVDDNRIMFGTFDADVILYNISEGYKAYQHSNSQSTLSDIALSPDSKKMVTADESGAVKLYDVESAKVEQEFSSENVDKVYSVAYRKDVIVTGGEDRRVGVYRKDEKAYHLKSDFLVYAVGLSPSGRVGVYSDGEAQNLQLFNTATKQKLDRLVGHKEIVNKIEFITEHSLVSAGEGQELFLWKID